MGWGQGETSPGPGETGKGQEAGGRGQTEKRKDKDVDARNTGKGTIHKGQGTRVAWRERRGTRGEDKGQTARAKAEFGQPEIRGHGKGQGARARRQTAREKRQGARAT